MTKLQLIYHLGRHMGPKWLAYRAKHAVAVRFGVYARQMPGATWEEKSIKGFLQDPRLAEPSAYWEYRQTLVDKFLFLPKDVERRSSAFASWDSPGFNPVVEADEILNGQFTFFSHRKVDTGGVPDWHRNYFTGEQLPKDEQWSRIPDFDAGDIKVVWELSRFAWVYPLVRAYWRTGDKHYSERFWELLEDWRSSNQPNRGVNWKCGQEITFRLMAWLFALYGFSHSASTTPQRVAELARMIAVSAERIEAHIGYAVSQKNNHGISEAVGLLTVGLLFPEFKDAGRWIRKGEQLLAKQIQELIYEDGAFSQHSMNYHRVLLHDLIWVKRVADVTGHPLPSVVLDRFAWATQFLCQVTDLKAGEPPVYGHNDGALILPLSNSDFWDFRPVLQSAWALNFQERLFPEGPWDETMLWCGQTEILEQPPVPHEQKPLKGNRPGGYVTLRDGEFYVFTRASGFRHRPGQADLLHVDLFWKGNAITCDPGTYSYNFGSIAQGLGRTLYHNTVSVDEVDQMDRVGPFMWLPWPNGETIKYSQLESGRQLWVGKHDGYIRLRNSVQHERMVLTLGDEGCVVIDKLESRQEHDHCMNWLLEDYPYQMDEEGREIRLKISEEIFLVSVSADTPIDEFVAKRAAEWPDGWRSRRYYESAPVISLRTAATGSSVSFCTSFSTSPVKCFRNDDGWEIRTEKRIYRIELNEWQVFEANCFHRKSTSLVGSAQ